MHLLNVIVVITFGVVNFDYVFGDAESFYERLRDQAATCVKGETYDVIEGSCRSSCLCMAVGVLKCDDSDCKYGPGNTYMEHKAAMFKDLRGAATNCNVGDEIEVEDCGTCMCVIKGVLNCQLLTRCLPGRGSGRRNYGHSNLIFG